MSYQRLPIEEFGRHLITAEDLDPIYCALARCGMEPDQLKRWLVAYLCYYHAGAASYISEARGAEFWSRMLVAAANEAPAPTGGRWPRAKERRHFRGRASVLAVEDLQELYPTPEAMINYLSTGELDFASVAKRVKRHPLFGDWVAFKAADLLERVLQVPIDYTHADVFMYEEPVKGALEVWRRKAGLPETARPKDQDAMIRQVVAYLTEQFRGLRAPPNGDRPIGLPEVETALCKWRAHLHGKYPPWNDIDEINEGLHDWLSCSATARRFAKAVPPRGT